MAHNLDQSTGKPAMAYVGKEPWHGLGEKLKPGESIETWVKAACLEWGILREPVRYLFKNKIREMSDRQVLIRSDNGAPLSIVSDSYCIFQPKEVVEFYRDLITGSAFSLETAGALDEGRKVWGLARSNLTKNILDTKDSINAFLLLASSCDKSLATTVAFTSVRVVCNNTLDFAMSEIKGNTSKKCLKINHNLQFDADEVKSQLGLIDNSWGNFIKNVEILAKTTVEKNDVEKYFACLFLSGKKDNEKISKNALVEIQNLQSALVNCPGQNLPTAKDTAWGLVNAVTYYVDHKRKSNNQSARLDSAWFGSGALLKDKAWDTAIKMFHKAA